MGTSQRKAVAAHRTRLAEAGLARFEVRGKASDRDLVRKLARALAENTPEAQELRALVGERLARGRKGGVLASLLAAPRAELDVTRDRVEPRGVDLG